MVSPGTTPHDHCADAQERSPERQQEDFLAYKIGFWDGFMASAEGWNGEYPMTPNLTVWLDARATDYARGRLAKEAREAAPIPAHYQPAERESSRATINHDRETER